MTKIPCPNGGCFEIDDGTRPASVWWRINDEDGLGELVDPHFLRPAHVQALGAMFGTFVTECLKRGLGVTVVEPTDAYQRLEAERRADADGWKDYS